MDRDVIIEKVNSIQNCLKRIHDITKGDVESIHHLDIQDVVVLNLQRSVQLTLDIASYVVSVKNLGVPKTLKDLFQILENNKYISKKISEKMQKMVGFRNIAVHDYKSIDLKILKAILKNHLKDLEQFYTEILDITLLK